MIVMPVIRVHPNSAIIMNEYYSDDGNSMSRGNSAIHNFKRINSNKLSVQSKRKMTRAINYMAHISPDKVATNQKWNSKFKFRLVFITLTLSSTQQHSDVEIKEHIFQPFLDYLRKAFKVDLYIWKAERQKNLNLHFHLIVDKYIPLAIVREKWNRYQDKLGYISNYYQHNSTKISTPTTQRDYFNLNSTDVHSTRKIKDLGRYLCKYMIKNNYSTKIRVKRNATHGTKIDRNIIGRYSSNCKKYLRNVEGIGRIWGCSYNLSNLKGGYDSLNNQLMDEIDILLNHKSVYNRNEAYFNYLSFDYRLLQDLKLTNLLSLIDDYCASHFSQCPAPS